MSKFELSPAAGNARVSVIRVNERINLGNTDELKKLAADAYEQGARCLLLDLTAVPSITSAGLRAILSIYKMLGGAAAFKLVSPSPDVRRTLEIAGMINHIQVFDDLPAAVASFQ